MRPEVGQVINNKYRLLRLIGDGGMGSVYEARHEVLGTSVALKFLHHELSRRAGLVQRFLQEARVSAQIQSQHVVRVTDVDQAQSGAYIVMEYLEGKTLQTLYEELYRAGRQLSCPDALEYAMQMLEGVEAAHKQGVVHRDLKPDNVMITADTKGRPLLKLLDFGIAKLKASGEYDRGLTRPGVIMGTPEYMAPEQAFSADAVDARADIFSLGVMIFEMLAGRRPVGGEEPQQIASAYLSGRIAQLTDLAPSLSPDLGAAVHRAMEALTKNRWQTVSDFRDALEPFAIAAKAPSAMPRGSLSNPGISVPPATPAPAAITPPATNVGGDAVAAVAAAKALPATIGPQIASGPDATNPAEPPAMSAPKLDDATPIGGFALADVEPAHQVPPTKEVSAYVPGGAPAADHAATAFAVPLGEMPPSVDHSPRPSGTAIGEPYFGGPPAAPAPEPFPMVADPAPAPPIAPSAYMPPAAAAPARPKRSKGSIFSSLPAILLLAAAIAGAVVGGVYFAQERAKADDHEDRPVTTVPSATVQSDPPADVPPVSTPVPAPTFKPPIQIQPKPAPPKGSNFPKPQPKPAPTPSTQPSGRPPVLPIFPPIVIPSTFPLSFPFPPAGPPSDPPRSQPDLPPRNRQDEPPRNRFDDPPRRHPQRDFSDQIAPNGYLHRSRWGETPHTPRPSRPRVQPGSMPYGPSRF